MGGWDTVFGTTGFEVLSSSTESGTYIVNGLSLVTSSLVKGDFGGAESKDELLNSPDGSFNFDDVDAFFLALTNPSGYLALNPSLTLADLTTLGDFGGAESKDELLNTPDGSFNFDDVDAFFFALTNPTGYSAVQPGARPGPAGVIPEPATLALLAPMGLALTRRRRI